AIRRALRNARGDLLPHAAHAAILAVFRNHELEIDLRAAVRILERELHAQLVVLAGNAHARAGTRATATAQALEEIGQVEVLERESAAGPSRVELPLPIRRRAKVLPRLESGAELVVGRALLRILERLVGLGDLLEFILGARLLVHVRMVLLRELPVRLLDVVRARAARDPEDRVVILVLHGSIRIGLPSVPWIRPPSRPASAATRFAACWARAPSGSCTTAGTRGSAGAWRSRPSAATSSTAPKPRRSSSDSSAKRRRRGVFRIRTSS